MSQPDAEQTYRQFAGTVRWPSDPRALTDTTLCPACFTRLNSLVCHKCALDLSHSASIELATTSANASSMLERRVELVGRIRYETQQLSVRAQEAASVVVPDATANAIEPRNAGPLVSNRLVSNPFDAAPQQGNVPAVVAEPPVRPAPSPGASGPRRSTVQVALLIAGVSLLSVFAIYFLVYAFINYGLIWRSVIIGGITVAAFATASILRRKDLRASAEGIAVFALILVYLDAFALRANDFFGLETANAQLYWGAVLVLTGVGFVLWHRSAGIRASSLVGFSAIVPGAWLFAWGATDVLQPEMQSFTAAAVAAVAGFTHLLVRPSASKQVAFTGYIERIIVLSTTLVAVVVAFVLAFLLAPESDWAPTIGVFIVAAITLAHARALAMDPNALPGAVGIGYTFASIGGVTTASAIGIASIRIAFDQPWFSLSVPAIAAVIAAVAFEALAKRSNQGSVRAQYGVAGWSSAGVLAIALMAPVFFCIWVALSGIDSALEQAWTLGPTDNLIDIPENTDVAVVALATVVAVAAIAWAIGGVLRNRAPILAWAGSLALVLAIPRLNTLWLVLAGWLLIAIVSFVILRSIKQSSGQPASALSRFRAVFGTLLITATTLMLLTGWASMDTWPWTLGLTVAIVIAGRTIVKAAEARAALLGTAAMIALYGVAAGTQHILQEINAPITWVDSTVNIAVSLAIACIVLLGASALPYRRVVTALDRRTIFWISIVTGTLTATLSWRLLTQGDNIGTLLLPQFALSLFSGLGAIAALVLWLALRANASMRAERIATSIALGPALYWTVDSFARSIGMPEFAQGIVPITAALLAAAGALAVTIIKPSHSPRWAKEIGVALVGVPALGSAITQPTDSSWLVLAIGAVVLLLSAIQPDGLFASTSRRKHLGWAALTLAVAALWWRLTGDDVTALEPYVLPVAGALLAVAYFSHRARARIDSETPSKAAPTIVLAGLLFGILPLALNGSTGDPMRPMIVFAASATLLLSGSFMRQVQFRRPYLDAMALAGAVGVIVVSIGRAALIDKSDLLRDTWLVAGFLVLVAAAFGQAQVSDADSQRLRSRAGQALALVGMTIVLIIEVPAMTEATLGPVRVMAVTLLFAAIHVIAMTIERPPFTRAVAWIAIAYSAIAILTGLAVGTLDTVEFGTVPLALALLVSGTARLRTQPEARSWPWLAPGILVLLLPSLLATMGDQALWRLVTIGVVSVAVLVIGTVKRLQAPFVLGLIIAIVHGVATFAPEIRAVYESQPWWLWAGLAGAVLVILAIRYEKRIQNFKSVAMKIAALR